MSNIKTQQNEAGSSPEDFEPGCTRQGWQHQPASSVDQFDTVMDFPRTAPLGVPMLIWSRVGTVDNSKQTLRRPLPFFFAAPSLRTCRCGCSTDIFGQHRDVLCWVGVHSLWGALQPGSFVKRERGGEHECDSEGWFSTSVPDALSCRRLEIVAGGMFLFGGV